jgi:hypothetical protein
MDIGVLAAIIVSGVLFLGLVTFGIVYYYRRRKQVGIHRWNRKRKEV